MLQRKFCQQRLDAATNTDVTTNTDTATNAEEYYLPILQARALDVSGVPALIGASSLFLLSFVRFSYEFSSIVCLLVLSREILFIILMFF